MLIDLRQSRTREWIIGILLMGLVFRALIPVGFMPSSERALVICHDGFPAQLLEHGGHHSDGRTQDHCPFGASSSAAPLPTLITPAIVLREVDESRPAGEPILALIQLVHLPEPRGPPQRS